jgi:aryl-alcohol dehydrogenase-like predicted oxidoreductase
VPELFSSILNISVPIDSAVQHLPRFQGENLAKNEQIRARVEAIAAAKKCSLNQLALAWVQHKGKDIVAIPGTYVRNTYSFSIEVRLY